eukprot:CAMPEP_0194419596 /NCGR_PEP_ID=MMETSP0176-20130528/18752_1 /TAXON_ID=216777 /ORGANISM="Proboscia alata, Strain PI-D3" /LENGTH=768 /DNA_ID=CAMNT_0039226651 /DNA_START=105 /DNA_END=2407 /DNA_ORIENTATION=+
MSRLQRYLSQEDQQEDQQAERTFSQAEKAFSQAERAFSSPYVRNAVKERSNGHNYIQSSNSVASNGSFSTAFCSKAASTYGRSKHPNDDDISTLSELTTDETTPNGHLRRKKKPRSSAEYQSLSSRYTAPDNRDRRRLSPGLTQPHSQAYPPYTNPNIRGKNYTYSSLASEHERQPPRMSKNQSRSISSRERKRLIEEDNNPTSISSRERERRRLIEEENQPKSISSRERERRRIIEEHNHPRSISSRDQERTRFIEEHNHPRSTTSRQRTRFAEEHSTAQNGVSRRDSNLQKIQLPTEYQSQPRRLSNNQPKTTSSLRNHPKSVSTESSRKRNHPGYKAEKEAPPYVMNLDEVKRKDNEVSTRSNKSTKVLPPQKKASFFQRSFRTMFRKKNDDHYFEMRDNVFDDASDSTDSLLEELEEAAANDLANFDPLDPEIVEKSRKKVQLYAGRIVESSYFKTFFIWLIILNSIAMGLSTFRMIRLFKRVYKWVKRIDATCLYLFTLEIGFQMIYLQSKFFTKPSLVFDVLIIGVSWLFSSFRIFRTFSLLNRVSSLRGIIKALFSIYSGLGSITFLIAILIYIFGVMVTTLYKETYAQGITSDDYFGNLFESFFTLFQVMTMDGWVGISRELMIGGYQLSWFLMIPYTILSGVIFFNLFLAEINEAIVKLEKDKLAEKILHDAYIDGGKMNLYGTDVYCSNRIKILNEHVSDLSKTHRNTMEALKTLQDHFMIFLNVKKVSDEKFYEIFAKLPQSGKGGECTIEGPPRHL